MTDWRSSLRADPTDWLLHEGCPAIRYRVLTELLDRRRDDPQVQQARQELLRYAPALQLARRQRRDGTWGGRIHASDSRKFQPCLENGLNLLFEYGWDRDTKPVRAAAKTLRSFLTATKKNLKLFEFQRVVKADERRELYYRWFLRILALGLLVRAGYLDEKGRIATLELLERTASLVEDPVARDPVEEIGATHPLIRDKAWREGYLFFPDYYVTYVFAHSPWLLDGELAKMRLKKIYDYVVSETYQSLAPDLGLVRTARGAFVRGHGLRIRPIETYEKSGDLDELLVILELLARLGLINRYPLLMTHLEWLHARQGRDGRWNLPTKAFREGSRWLRLIRLERDWRSPARKEADLTLRVLLIFKYQWERQMRMLDRREDAYPF